MLAKIWKKYNIIDIKLVIYLRYIKNTFLQAWNQFHNLMYNSTYFPYFVVNIL